MTPHNSFYSRAYQEGSGMLSLSPVSHPIRWNKSGLGRHRKRRNTSHFFLLLRSQHLSYHLCGPQLLPNSAFTFLYPHSMKEIHYHVLTRTQMQREMQSSKCGCSHLPVQVITGILKVSKEGDRAEKFRQLLSGQGGKSAVLKCTGGGQKT